VTNHNTGSHWPYPYLKCQQHIHQTHFALTRLHAVAIASAAMPPSKRTRLLRRLIACFVANTGLLLLLVGLMARFANESTYFRFGPGLRVVGVPIDTWPRYYCLHAVLLLTQAIDMLVSEFANPILSFNIYNPDKDVIVDFTHFELQFFAQSLWVINGVRAALMLAVSISQFDIAVAKVLYTEITGLFTVYMLLSEKRFEMQHPCDDEEAGALLGD